MSAEVAPLQPWIDFLTGQALGGYVLRECIGSGNFGLVFEAVSSATSARVAVKVLTPSSDGAAISDFDNEGSLLQKLNSCDGVINYVDGGVESISMESNGLKIPLPLRFHVMNLASGSVAELILDPDTRASLDWAERIGIWRGMIMSVRQMHLNRVAHRDLKTSNCLLMVSGNTSKVKLADLGRSKDLSIPTTLPVDHYLAGRGDLRFAPPEHLWLQGGSAAEDFIAADYYGLGSLLVELVTGQPLSSLVMGNYSAVIKGAIEDHKLGLHSDLSVLKLRYRAVISEIVAEMPKSIQEDARALLLSMCGPLPAGRLEHSPFRRDRLQRDPLEWVLRRADIMIRRLKIDARQARQTTRRMERTA
jgi:serine/threonine protein kinase